ncbi:hypothetical protein ACHAWT_003149 [Skeletonema menzelii]
MSTFMSNKCVITFNPFVDLTKNIAPFPANSLDAVLSNKPSHDGELDGLDEGETLGSTLGEYEGCQEGSEDGLELGFPLGEEEGICVGLELGDKLVDG